MPMAPEHGDGQGGRDGALPVGTRPDTGQGDMPHPVAQQLPAALHQNTPTAGASSPMIIAAINARRMKSKSSQVSGPPSRPGSSRGVGLWCHVLGPLAGGGKAVAGTEPAVGGPEDDRAVSQVGDRPGGRA